MYIKNRYLSVLFKLILAGCGIVGIQLQLNLFSTDPNWGMFRYFTNLSNLLCVVYFIFAAFRILFSKDISATSLIPPLKFMTTMSITVTLLIAHFLLSDFTMDDSMAIALNLLHYVVPLLTLLDWLLFDHKGQSKKSYPLLALLPALFYYIYVLIASNFGAPFAGNSRFPYPFLNTDSLGVGRVLFTVVVLFVGFTVLGYLFYLIDHLLARYTSSPSRQSKNRTP